MRAVIYARFSSNRQTEESIDAQVRACREYALSCGFDILNIYADEAVSGKGSHTLKRVQYQKMLRDAQKGMFDIILIHKYDRIARSLDEHVSLEKRLNSLNIRLIATAQDFGTTNESKLIRTLMWSLSEYYIDNLANEARKGLKETALKGLHNGGVPPFGYDVVDQKYVINKTEAFWVKRFFSAALTGEGFTAILKEMEDTGIRGKRGAPIKYTQVYEMLRNEKYTGVYIYSPTEARNRSDRRSKPDAIRIENSMPAIISKDTFAEVQKIMNSRKNGGKKNNYLCSGRVYCSCGAKMHVTKSTRGEYTYHYYRCSEKCGAPGARMEDIDNAAYAYLDKILSEDNYNMIITAIKDLDADESRRISDYNKNLKISLTKKRAEYEALMQNIATGALPAEVLSDIGIRMKNLKSEIEGLEKSAPPKKYSAAFLLSWIKNLKESPREHALALFIDRIDVKNKTEYQAHSTLYSVLEKHGCGGSQHSLPKILFSFTYIVQGDDTAPHSEGWCSK